MTILVVALLGAGTILIASALDNTPIVETFQKIISGKPIDWTGSTPPPTTPTTPTTGGTTPTPKTKYKNDNCPAGTTFHPIIPSDPNSLGSCR